MSKGLLTQRQTERAQAAQSHSSLPKTIQRVPTSSPSASSALQNSFVEEIRLLIQRWQGEALVGEGWLHLVEFHDRTKDQVGDLPNGQPIPIDYFSENWYHLDDSGNLVELVALMKDLDGNTVQVSTYKDGLWQNLTLGGNWSAEADPVSLDFGFVRDIESSAFFGSSISRQEFAGDGNEPMVVFSISDSFEPTQINGYRTPVSAGVRQIAFDQASGAVLFVQRLLRDAFGNELIVEHVRITTIEKISSPPSEIQDYISR